MGAGTAAFASPGRSVGIMAAGPLELSSRFEQFILAASILAEAYEDVVFSIVGAGPAERGLRRMREELNLTDRLTFVPSVRRMDDLFDGVDIYVQPYVATRLDLRLLEAMAAGVVVLARNGGAVDFVRDGVNGLELTNVDEHGLAMLIGKLLEDPAAGRRIGGQARQFVQENHLSGVSAQRVIERLRPIIVSRQTLKIS
jgi:glycosyltransferase involved in cell wall biosynthesis